jgi:hypothetical protein
MILNRNSSSTYSHSVSGSTIADRRDAYETNKKNDVLEMFGPTTSLTIQADDDEGNSGPTSISGPEIGDLTERNQLDKPIDSLSIPEGLSYYIQAAQHNHRAFLTTNLCHANNTAFVTALSSTWLIGRSRNCAIVVHERSVSRCHAVVGYDVQQGFYLMDVGSSNGTYLNRKRLSVLKRYALADGDLITLCNLPFEFFIAA